MFYRSENYFATELVGCEWKGFGPRVFVPCYRRPLQAVINPLLDAGFALDRVLEPLPAEAFKAADPEGYQQLLRFPEFICFRARKQ